MDTDHSAPLLQAQNYLLWLALHIDNDDAVKAKCEVTADLLGEIMLYLASKRPA